MVAEHGHASSLLEQACAICNHVNAGWLDAEYGVSGLFRPYTATLPSFNRSPLKTTAPADQPPRRKVIPSGSSVSWLKDASASVKSATAVLATTSSGSSTTTSGVPSTSAAALKAEMPLVSTPKTTSLQLIPSEHTSAVPHVSAKAAAASMARFGQAGNRLTSGEKQKGSQVPSDFFDVNLASSDEEDTMEGVNSDEEFVSAVTQSIKSSPPCPTIPACPTSPTLAADSSQSMMITPPNVKKIDTKVAAGRVNKLIRQVKKKRLVPDDLTSGQSRRPGTSEGRETPCLPRDLTSVLPPISSRPLVAAVAASLSALNQSSPDAGKSMSQMSIEGVKDAGAAALLPVIHEDDGVAHIVDSQGVPKCYTQL